MSTIRADGKQPTNQAQPNLKLSHLLDGLAVSRNFKLLALFSCFILWLFVVSWIRHHEPLLHEVMGRGVAHSTTTDADRQIINRIGRSFPLKTSPQMSSIYQPDLSVAEATEEHSQAANTPDTHVNKTADYPSVGPGQAISAPAFVEAKFGFPRDYALASGVSNNYNMAEPILASYTAPSGSAVANKNPATTVSHYYVSINSPNGTYLKTVVNR